jgi:hypothetical protein
MLKTLGKKKIRILMLSEEKKEAHSFFSHVSIYG